MKRNQYPKLLLRGGCRPTKQSLSKFIQDCFACARNDTRFLILISLIAGFIFQPVDLARADTLSDLQQRQADLNRQIQANRKALSQKKIDISNLQSAIASLDGQITAVQKDVDLSASKIEITNQQINKLKDEIAQKEKELETQKENLYETMRVIYETPQKSTVEIVVSSNSLSEVVDRAQYIESLNYQIETTINTITKLKSDLENEKNQQEVQKADLEKQKAALVAQKQGLQSQQQLKNDLLNNTQSTIASLQGQQNDAQAKIAQVNQQIQALTGTSNWGSQIISQDDPSWYYTQIGNYTSLGNSPYTVNQYGCLITSYAMVSTYYGNRITPTDIAQMYWHFTGGGYFQGDTSDFGIVVASSGPINWVVVDNELANNHPVIVSIYLPSVGAINGDGSSHFIVIKGKSDDKYLMQDPIGHGRSYDLNQVRSMKVVRPI